MTELKQNYLWTKSNLPKLFAEHKDEFMREFAVKYAKENMKVHVSGLQRCFLIGYNHAVRLQEWLEDNNYITECKEGGRDSLVFDSDNS